MNPMGGGGEANDGGGAISNVIEVTNPDGSDAVTINIRISNGPKFSVQASLESSVESFKSVLAQNCDIPAEQQRLIYKARLLKDDQTLKSYGLEAEHTVHLVRRFLPAASTNTANTVEGETMGRSEVLRRVEVLRRIRDCPELIEAFNWVPYLARNPVIYRQRVADRILVERIRESYQNSFNRILAGDGGDGGGGGATDQSLHSNPQNMNQQSLLSQPGQQQSTRDAGQMDGGTENISGIGTRGSTTPNNNSNVGLEQLYASQLARLQELGFSDTRQNLEALISTVGNVPGAIHRLLVNNMILDLFN